MKYYTINAVKDGEFYRIAYILNNSDIVQYKPFYFRTLEAALNYVDNAKCI